ncbi:hypothetical protein D3C83_150840 [compost metagenome]
MSRRGCGASVTYIWLSALAGSPACAMATAPFVACVCSLLISATPIDLPLPPVPHIAFLVMSRVCGSPNWITKPGTTRWMRCPL